jgi:hypothetical protein
MTDSQSNPSHIKCHIAHVCTAQNKPKQGQYSQFTYRAGRVADAESPRCRVGGGEVLGRSLAVHSGGEHPSGLLLDVRGILRNMVCTVSVTLCYVCIEFSIGSRLSSVRAT